MLVTMICLELGTNSTPFTVLVFTVTIPSFLAAVIRNGLTSWYRLSQVVLGSTGRLTSAM